MLWTLQIYIADLSRLTASSLENHKQNWSYPDSRSIIERWRNPYSAKVKTHCSAIYRMFWLYGFCIFLSKPSLTIPKSGLFFHSLQDDGDGLGLLWILHIVQGWKSWAAHLIENTIFTRRWTAPGSTQGHLLSQAWPLIYICSRTNILKSSICYLSPVVRVETYR